MRPDYYAKSLELYRIREDYSLKSVLTWDDIGDMPRQEARAVKLLPPVGKSRVEKAVSTEE